MSPYGGYSCIKASQLGTHTIGTGATGPQTAAQNTQTGYNQPMRNLTKLAALLAALALASACGTQESQPTATTETDGDVVATQQADVARKIGETHTYPDGLAVTVEKIEPIQNTELDTTKDGTPVLITITVRNGSKKVVDTATFGEWITSGGVEATTWTDPDIGAQDPSSDLLPGRSITYRVAALVQNPQAIQIDWGCVSIYHPHSHWTTP